MSEKPPQPQEGSHHEKGLGNTRREPRNTDAVLERFYVRQGITDEGKNEESAHEEDATSKLGSSLERDLEKFDERQKKRRERETKIPSKEKIEHQEARKQYRAYKEEMDTAREAYLDASKNYEQKKDDAGFLAEFFNKSALEDEKKDMLAAEKKYDTLLDELRNKRQERMETFMRSLREGMDETKKARYVARHEALLDSHIDNEVQLLEAIRYNKDSKGESRNRFIRGAKKGWNYYRKLPLAKRLALGVGIAGGAGLTLGALGTGGALATGGVFATRRAVGGFFGSIAALETKRLGDKSAEKGGEIAHKKQKETFSKKGLSQSRKERLRINKGVKAMKGLSTAGAVGSAFVAGGSATEATDAVLDATSAADGAETGAHRNTGAIQKQSIVGKIGAAAKNLISPDSAEAGEIRDATGAVHGLHKDVGQMEMEPSHEKMPTMKSSHGDEVETQTQRTQLVEQQKEDSLEDMKESVERDDMTRSIAEKMGIEVKGDMDVVYRADVPIEINGQKVPTELLSDKQQEALSIADRQKEVMDALNPTEKSGVGDTQSPHAGDPSFTHLESDTSGRVDHIESDPTESVDASEKGEPYVDSEEIDTAQLYTEEVPKGASVSEPKDPHMPEAGDIAKFPEDAPKDPHMPESGDVAAFEDPHMPESGDIAESSKEAPESAHRAEPTDNTEPLGGESGRIHMPESGDVAGVPTESLHTPEAGDVTETTGETHEIADLYRELGVIAPEEFQVEGVYESGASIESELEDFLRGNEWLQEQYPDLTDAEYDAAAHIMRTMLEEHPDMAEKLQVHNGDWDKVIAGDKYSFYVDRDVVESAIAQSRDASESVPKFDEQYKQYPSEDEVPVFDEESKQAPEAKEVPTYDEQYKQYPAKDEVPVFDDVAKEPSQDIDTVPDEPTPEIVPDDDTVPTYSAEQYKQYPSKEEGAVPEGGVEDMSKGETVPAYSEQYKQYPSEAAVPVFDAGAKTAPEVETVPVFDGGAKSAPEEGIPQSKPLAEEMLEEMRKPEVIPDDVEAQVPMPETTPSEHEPLAQEASGTPEEQPESVAEEEMRTEESPSETTSEAPLNFSEDATQAKAALEAQGADYQGLKTRPYIDTLFKTDGVFDTMLQGRKPEILSNWGPMSYARLEDILDSDKTITYTINGPPITMGMEAEQLCCSIVTQLERGLADTVPDVEEIIEQGKVNNISLGELIKELSERVTEAEAHIQEDVPSVPEGTEAGAPIPLHEYEVPELKEQTVSTLAGAQNNFSASLPYIDVEADVQSLVQGEYLEAHPDWSEGTARELYENESSTAFREAVDRELLDIALDLRGDNDTTPLPSITVDWSKLGQLTPQEVLEQLHQHENMIEQMNNTDTLTDSENTINVLEQ